MERERRSRSPFVDRWSKASSEDAKARSDAEGHEEDEEQLKKRGAGGTDVDLSEFTRADLGGSSRGARGAGEDHEDREVLGEHARAGTAREQREKAEEVDM